MFTGWNIIRCAQGRAMELINQFEPVRRGIYGGAVGYLVGQATWISDCHSYRRH